MNKLSGMNYIAQANILFIICVLPMMMIMVIEILGVFVVPNKIENINQKGKTDEANLDLKISL